MTVFGSSDAIEDALSRLGQLLEAGGHRYRILVVGGAALNLRGVIRRPTVDVDVIALLAADDPERPLGPAPATLPEPLSAAVRIVARDLALPTDWLNTTVASEWHPEWEGMGDRAEWRQYAGLGVGLAARADLIELKLHATADHASTGSRHFKDLVALRPTEAELSAAAEAIARRTAGLDLKEAIRHVLEHPGAG